MIYKRDYPEWGVRIVRLRDTGSMLVSDGIVFGGRYVNPIDSDDYEEGGRLAFGPDGDLYVATGDSHRPELAQDLNSLNGKILRLRVPGTDADFTAPSDNPRRHCRSGVVLGSPRASWSQ